MSDVTTLSIKMDRKLKSEADKLFAEMGMNLTTAVNVFVRQAVLEQAIPFRIYRPSLAHPSEINISQRLASLQEIRDLLSDADVGTTDLGQARADRRTVRYERTD